MIRKEAAMNKPEKIRNSEIKMNNKVTYTGNIHWWFILIFMGCFVWTIVAYIYQWGNNPVNKAGLFIFCTIWVIVSIVFFVNRFILTIDNEFIKFKLASWGRIKIHITQIKDVSVEKMNLKTCIKIISTYYKGTKYQFDFTKQTVKIQTKNGNIYQIAIKDAERIKEEIEKRMVSPNEEVS